MPYPPRSAYHRLPTSETSPNPGFSSEVQRWRKISVWLATANIITLAGIMILALMTPSEADCIRKLSVFSPALEGIEMEEVTFQNSFNEPSIYRGPPTPEIEDAWHRLYRFGLMSIPDDKMALLNKSASDSFERTPDSLGGGFRAMPDVLHQLHCLNTIRQYTWLQVGGHYGEESRYKLPVPHALQSNDVGNRMHADHCIETIRKVLMCHSDVTPLFDIVDLNNPLGRKGDFNVFTKCRSFEKLQYWLRDNMKIPFAELAEDTA